MSIQHFEPKAQAVVQVTSEAMAHFNRQLLASTTANAVRLSVKKSGCTGYMYVLDLVDEAKANDTVLNLDDGLTFLVDARSESIVRGLTVDYVTEGVNRQIKFLNPNAKDYCGCGESFSVE